MLSLYFALNSMLHILSLPSMYQIVIEWSCALDAWGLRASILRAFYLMWLTLHIWHQACRTLIRHSLNNLEPGWEGRATTLEYEGAFLRGIVRSRALTYVGELGEKTDDLENHRLPCCSRLCGYLFLMEIRCILEAGSVRTFRKTCLLMGFKKWQF